jgi:hypothetical protein
MLGEKMSIVMCPAGNFYADSGDVQTGIVLTILVTGLIALIGYAVYSYVLREKIDFIGLLVLIGIVIFICLINVIDFIFHVV